LPFSLHIEIFGIEDLQAVMMLFLKVLIVELGQFMGKG